MSSHADPEQPVPEEVPRFGPPYDWQAIDAAVKEWGAAVVGGLAGRDLCARVNGEIDRWLARDRDSRRPRTGTPVYDTFLGFRTVRLQRLVTRIPVVRELVTHEEILAWAHRMLTPVCRRILLSTAEMIQIGPQETAQFVHRDSDAWWPELLRQEHAVSVTAMVGLTPFTAENGGTRIALGSHRWPAGRRPKVGTLRQAIMDQGDVLLFRADVFHGGGRNGTPDQYRRGCAVSYCAGWLRPQETGTLVAPPDVAAGLPPEIAELLGYAVHDSTSVGGGIVGMLDNGDPRGTFPPERLGRRR
ncbi:phytanoyl-CoA dioxygenase family protein [Actinomadura rugatobispora]|uniref:Phytanoyl-CoA dioxygenase family protein n=1 Tax=Actinomadura rugatobispora TaxID=1994 RepID=A0ABW1ACI8_9ACTN|nr:hypothetical protein GCM10010200_022320 [Actinomadura rugatobispora]